MSGVALNIGSLSRYGGRINSLSRTIIAAAVQSAWSPLSLFAASEQGVWYDPSDLTTMFQDSAGTTPVTATGQPVGKILDKSGRGNHATQATSAYRPTLQQNGSGLYYLSFDGADDSMSTSAINFTATDEMTIVAGLLRTSTTGSGIFLEASADYSASNGTFAVYEQSGAAGMQLYAKGTVASSAVTASGGTPRTSVYTAAIDISSPLMRLRENGGSWNQSTASIGTGNFGTHQLFIGRRNSSSLPFKGGMYQLIVRGLTTSDPAEAESYVAARSGVTL